METHRIRSLTIASMKMVCITLVSVGTPAFGKPTDSEEFGVSDKLNSGGAIGNRIVSVSAQSYRKAFNVHLEIGQCPYVFENGNIKTCSTRFKGDVVFIPKSSMDVSVSRVQNAEDILNHGMGGVGASVGVLGLVSVSAKVRAAVTTETSRRTLTFMSSYTMTKGVNTLHNVQPVTTVPEKGALYLSEIELGGDELLLVTLEFESESKKTDVEVSAAVKVLFWTITAKVNYIHRNLKMSAKARVQLKSSWRGDEDISGLNLATAIPIIEKMEEKFSKGPQELKDMSNENEKLHNFYHFASWNQSPYGANFNQALINHDLQILSEQKIELESLVNKIESVRKRLWSADQRLQLNRLNETLSEKTAQLSSGLLQYHDLAEPEREKIWEIYGSDKAPFYYSRQLSAIIKE